MRKILENYGRDFIIIFIIMVVFYLQHLLSFHLGINFEEGRDGNAYYLAMQGYKPYRDFEWVYGPFSLLIYPFIMKIFGVNLIVLRLSYITFASLVIPLTYFLARNIMPPIWSGVASLLAVNFFDVPYYTYNHIFVVLGELSCLLMILRAIKTNKYKTNLVYAVFFAAITFLAKPFSAGIVLFFLICLFIAILKLTNRLSLGFVKAMIIFAVTFFLFTSLFAYFYLGGAVKNYFLENTPFSPYPIGSLHDITGISFLESIKRSLQRCFDLLIINKVLNVISFKMFKKIIVDWFDDFIFCLPFLIPIAIFIIYKKFRKTNVEIQNIFQGHKITILFFIIFSVLISAENILITHRMGRAFNIQITFVLFIFFCYLLVKIVSKNRKVFLTSLITSFVVFLSFLHFFRYPWSRSKKFTVPLNLERAKGVMVTVAEKQLYESLSNYLSRNLNKEDKIVTLGYYPQFTFLTAQNDVFYNKEGIFLNLQYLTKLADKDKWVLPKLKLLEQEIIYTLELHKPKIVLDIVSEGAKPLYNNLVGDYIRKKYILKNTFGPAEIQGIKGDGNADMSQVDLYILKGDQG